MKRPNAILWFQRDLRLEDNPALNAAWNTGYNPVCIYIHDPSSEGRFHAGAASLSWLHYALLDLDQQLRDRQSRLHMLQGPTLQILKEAAGKWKARAIFWNQRYEPDVLQRDKDLNTALREAGLTTQQFNATLLFEPGSVLNQQAQPYRVYTPFSKACLLQPIRSPITEFPKFVDVVPQQNTKLCLKPLIPWDQGFWKTYEPTRRGALKVLEKFCKENLNTYATNRDFPFQQQTSSLSPYLHFGQISPYEAWSVACEQKNSLPWLRQMLWREFSWQLLYHYPESVEHPLNPAFDKFQWLWEPTEWIAAWKAGKTGYPFVDAGMRELWETGTMHNRARMATGSFLVKHLRIHWRVGYDWFWDTLLDADAGNNLMGWQWIAGCGADAAPYFRIFNPTLQGEKFDPEGVYIRRFVPELRDLPKQWIHQPEKTDPMSLRRAGIRLGEDYPFPIVQHKEARAKALAAYRAIKES